MIIEHDATLFDNAERLIVPVGSALKEAGREALVVLYSPAMDRSFSAIARQADRLIELVPAAEPGPGRRPGNWQHGRRDTRAPGAQKTLDMI